MTTARTGAESKETPGMKQARKALEAPKAKASDAHAPPPSLFPMPPAAREALRLRKDAPETPTLL